MAVLAIDSNELDGILLRLRAIMAREENDVPDPGGNPADDQVSAALQDLPDDLSREEVVEEIEALNDDQQDALVALSWLGRGDYEPQEWENALAMARERHVGSTAQYLLSHPLVAEQIEEGWEMLREAGELD